jgi:excisionase family DNA binding protein
MSTDAKKSRRQRVDGAPYTVAEAAERLNLAISTVYDLIRDGQIRARKVGLRRARYRIDEADLLDYWQSCAGDESPSRPARDHLS